MTNLIDFPKFHRDIQVVNTLKAKWKLFVEAKGDQVNTIYVGHYSSDDPDLKCAAPIDKKQLCDSRNRTWHPNPNYGNPTWSAIKPFAFKGTIVLKDVFDSYRGTSGFKVFVQGLQLIDSCFYQTFNVEFGLWEYKEILLAINQKKNVTRKGTPFQVKDNEIFSTWKFIKQGKNVRLGLNE